MLPNLNDKALTWVQGVVSFMASSISHEPSISQYKTNDFNYYQTSSTQPKVGRFLPPIKKDEIEGRILIGNNCTVISNKCNIQQDD